MTIKFNNVYLENVSTVAGPFVIEGPLKDNFDKKFNDFYDGEKTFEKCEMKELKESIKILLDKTKYNEEDISFGISADLMNQLTISNFVYSKLNIPFLGVYNACASVCEEILIAASILENEKNKKAICTTSSHNMTSERQFRNPVEYGAPKPKTTTFTVTGAASLMLTNAKTDIKVTSATIGKVIDMGIKDANNMGAAMAPAALDTLIAHFKDTGRNPSYYDAILTGDLGHIGKEILTELAETKGYNIKSNYNDCGVLMFDKATQDTHSGGSGCACCATIFSGYLFNKLKQKELKKILLIATGALTNATSNQQGESIPGIAHAIAIETDI